MAEVVAAAELDNKLHAATEKRSPGTARSDAVATWFRQSVDEGLPSGVAVLARL